VFIKRAIKGIIFSACLLGWAGISHGQSVVAPAQIIVGDDSQYNLVSANGGAVSVTGFDPAGVRISVAQGNVRITTTTGLTAPGSATSADWTGASSIAFEGTLADINARWPAWRCKALVQAFLSLPMPAISMAQIQDPAISWSQPQWIGHLQRPMPKPVH